MVRKNCCDTFTGEGNLKRLGDEMSDSGIPTGEEGGAEGKAGMIEAPVLTLLSAVVFPNMIASVQVGRDRNMALIDRVKQAYQSQGCIPAISSLV